jgi:hypothetical protein
MLDIMVNEQEAGKIRGTEDEICRIVGCTKAELGRFFGANKAHKFADVTIRNGCVTIICRRLYRAFLALEATRKRVSRHRVKKKRKSNVDVTPYSSTSTSLKDKKTVTFALFMEVWNSHESLTQIKLATQGRRRKFTARLKEPAFGDNWRQIVERIAGTPFLCGDNERGWKADVDWILGNSTNYAKVLEGKYESQRPAAIPPARKGVKAAEER